jgi:phosphatidate cytidylyltransferase
MALNIATLKTRSLTAVIFVAVMLVGLLWNFWSFLILFTIVHFGCWYELLKLMKKIYGEKYLQYSLLGLVYITVPILSMINLQQWTIGFFAKDVSGEPCFAPAQSDSLRFTILVLVVATIWINDTMAYIVGSLIGKTPFSKISPKKTWEGTIGGALLAIGVGLLIAQLEGLNIFHLCAITAIVAISGTIGDLFESKLKRMANVKDSGSIMPGHGGFLDRFDSLLFAAPAVWLYVQLFM